MKKYSFLMGCLALVQLSFYHTYASNPHMDSTALHLNVKNIKHDQGKIFIAVFDREEAFMKERYRDKAILVESINDLKVELKLPYGKYAISIFHDVNNNEELNTNFVGIPKEPYGFSNNPKIKFGPPNFEQTSFELSNEKYEIEIFLK